MTGEGISKTETLKMSIPKGLQSVSHNTSTRENIDKIDSSLKPVK